MPTMSREVRAKVPPRQLFVVICAQDEVAKLRIELTSLREIAKAARGVVAERSGQATTCSTGACHCVYCALASAVHLAEQRPMAARKEGT